VTTGTSPHAPAAPSAQFAPPLSGEATALDWSDHTARLLGGAIDLLRESLVSPGFGAWWDQAWIGAYGIAQVAYLVSFAVFFHFLHRPINWVDSAEGRALPEAELPFMVLAYPVLRENPATMHSTFTALARTDYPPSRYAIIAVVNSDDDQTIEALQQLQGEFPFVQVMQVPPTDHVSWTPVWSAWENNQKAYWYHRDKTKGLRDLPAKKTRQLIYLVYRLVDRIGSHWVLDYIDADSIPPPDHFRIAAGGLRHYDVLQSTNVAGNLLDSPSASLHAFDHMCWDGFLYPHMSADGRHPYYVLGKGLFYRATDLVEFGGFNPWIAIEDPEVGLRLWANGKRLGIIAEPLIEEVPRTFARGVVQRSRWMCGFFQTLGRPLKRMGLPFARRMQARLNIVPVLSLPVNLVGLPTGLHAAYLLWIGANPFPFWLVALSCVNIGLYLLTMSLLYRNAWYRTRLVLRHTGDRLSYLLRVNPVALFLYHAIWTIPIAVGFAMFITDRGRTWLRTTKYDALRAFVDKRHLP